jgi:deferrochelatase/peroxidase EfeB
MHRLPERTRHPTESRRERLRCQPCCDIGLPGTDAPKERNFTKANEAVTQRGAPVRTLARVGQEPQSRCKKAARHALHTAVVPVSLTQLIDDRIEHDRWVDADAQRFAERIQANVITAMGRNYLAMLMFWVPASAVSDTRAWLKALPITTERQRRSHSAGYQAGQPGHETVTLLWLTTAGLALFGHIVRPVVQAGSFRVDQFGGTVNDWEIELLGLRQDAPSDAVIHGCVVVANDHAATLEDATKQRRSELENLGCRIVSEQHGRTYRNAEGRVIEHFGFVDGISNPIVTTTQLAKQGRKDTSATPAQLVFADPLTFNDTSNTRHDTSNTSTDAGTDTSTGTRGWGSLVAVLKLEQHPQRWHEILADNAFLPHLTPADKGALIMGRHRNGQLVDGQTLDGQTLDGQTLDGTHLRCPANAHISKMNPRFADDTADDMQPARRGMTYGDRWQDPHGEFADRPEGGVGLLFCAYMASAGQLRQQLEWADDEDFPEIESGTDPFLTADTHALWTPEARDSASHGAHVRPVITFRGGGWFFAPSPAGVQRL